MSKVIADISMSLDGYVTACGVDQEHGLGIGGEAIHAWVLEEPRSPVDEAVLASSFEKTGAVVMGRRLYDIVDGPNGWNDDVGYGHDQNQSAAPRCYVVTHEPPAQVRLASRFRFVTEGVAAAVDQARATAGDKDVVVMGGANVIDQSLATRLVDELATCCYMTVRDLARYVVIGDELHRGQSPDRHLPACGGVTGSCTVTQRPPPALGVRVRFPSCAWVMLLTIARPRPTPPAWSVRMRLLPR
jgi:dihydrofolate reductase